MIMIPKGKWSMLLLSLLIMFGSAGCASKKTTSIVSIKGGKSSSKSATQKTITYDKECNKGSQSGKVTSSHKSNCTKLGVTPSGDDNPKLYAVSVEWLGTKYKYGGNTKSGTDCSGFTGQLYKAVYGKGLYRSSADIYSNNCTTIKKSNLREGDLVFFRTDGKNSKTPNHVGVYLKENKFIHASTSKGVIVSDLTQQYYVTNFIAAGRVK